MCQKELGQDDPTLHVAKGSLDNDTEKDFGFLLRRAIDQAKKQATGFRPPDVVD